ncbi:MAG: hypothetical protein IKR04_01460 [Clostridia bacterium]|nr:hypothetical protein [Clostridia bacterium]
MKVVKYIVTLIGLILFFNISLYMVSLIPSDFLIDNVKESVLQIEKEGEQFEICGKYITLDNFTELIMLNEIVSIDYTDPLNSYLKVRKNFNKDITKYELKDTNHELLSYGQNKIGKDDTPIADDSYSTLTELINFLDNKVTISVDYARYYHGYLVYLRPLFILFNIGELRWIMFFIFLSLLIALAYNAYKKLGLKYMFAICFSILAFEYLFIPFSVDFSSTFFVMMLSSILVLLFAEKINWSSMKYICFIVGAITCFIDFLTVPILTLTLPLLIYVLYCTKNRKHDNKILFKDIFISCVMWSISYTITWISKWIIYDIFMEDSLIGTVIEQLKFRSLSEPYMFLECFYNIVIHIALIMIIYIVSTFFFGKNVKKAQFVLNNKWCVIFVGCVPLLFDMIKFNHFINHSFFTYRDFIPLFAVIWLLYFDYLGKNASKRKK